MKRIITALTILISLSASAQQDSTKTLIRLQWKVKHCLLMAAQLSERNTLADSRAKDSLALAIGSGNNVDSNTTISLRASYVLRFIKLVAVDMQGGEIVDVLYEIKNSTVAQGWRNLPSQLTLKIAAGGEEGKAAQWLRDQFNIVNTKFSNTLLERYSAGKTFILNPVDQ